MTVAERLTHIIDTLPPREQEVLLWFIFIRSICKASLVLIGAEQGEAKK